MRHVVCFSGGKDSTALILWAIENLGDPGKDFDVVFCDTGWESPITMAYVAEINQTLLGGKLITLTSEKYGAPNRKPHPLRADASPRDRHRWKLVSAQHAQRTDGAGFVNLVIDRKMIPGVKSRFCTQELKVFPLHRYFESIDDDVTSYQGIRADESKARAAMLEVQWLDDAGGYWIKRPILRWTAEQCFAMMAKHGVKPNPLYLTGSARVGCWPCIMTGLGELKRIIQFYPELKQRLVDLEKQANDAAGDPDNYRTWFRADKVPARFCSKSVVTKDGRTVPIPTVEDVFAYIERESESTLRLFDEERSCLSVYNLCE